MEQHPLPTQEVKSLLRFHMDMFKMNLLKLMNENKISGAELGRRIDKDRFYIDYILNHPCPNPTTSNVLLIANIFNVSHTDLFKQ